MENTSDNQKYSVNNVEEVQTVAEPPEVKKKIILVFLVTISRPNSFYHGQLQSMLSGNLKNMISLLVPALVPLLPLRVCKL